MADVEVIRGVTYEWDLNLSLTNNLAMSWRV